VYAFFCTCDSTCVACAACLVFCSTFITIFLFLSSFPTNLIDTYVMVPIDILIALLIPLSSAAFCISIFCNSCVCVCQLVHALPTSFIFIHIDRRIYMHICCDYSVMTVTPYDLYTPIIIHLCVTVFWQASDSVCTTVLTVTLSCPQQT